MESPNTTRTTLGHDITVSIEVIDDEPLLVIEVGDVLFDMDISQAAALHRIIGDTINAADIHCLVA